MSFLNILYWYFTSNHIRVPGELDIEILVDLVQLCFKLFVYDYEVHLIDDLNLSKDKDKLCTR